MALLLVFDVILLERLQAHEAAPLELAFMHNMVCLYLLSDS